MEFIHNGGSRWVLVLYGLNKKLMAYYRIWFKDPITHSTLYVIYQFITNHGIPRHFIMNSHSVLGKGTLWKKVIGHTFNSLFLSEIDKHNQNPSWARNTRYQIRYH